jgi:hypothetical protein
MPEARAQTTGQFTDTPVITVAGNSVPLNYGFALTSYLGGPFGSMSAPATLDGFTYQAFVDVPYNTKQGGGYHNTQLLLGGFSADPGKGWLTSVTVNGKVFVGSAATYIFTSGQAHWYWTTGPAFNNHAGAVQMTMLHAGNSGWIMPKYQVVGLTYAPPGSKSSALYSNGFINGTSSSNTSTFTSGVSVKYIDTAGFDLFGILSGNSTQTFSAGWKQEQDSSNSLSVVNQSSTQLTVPGPLSSGLGVDHDYDQVYVWLNPAVFLEIFSNVVTVGGDGWDERDTINGMDVVTLTIGQLRGTQPISDPALQARLNRTWDSSLGALTSTEFLAIANADPFAANPSFNPNTDTSHRYELPESGSPPMPVDLIFNYIPEPPGGQPTGQTYTSNYSATSVSGQLAKTTTSVGYSIDGTAAAAFVVGISAKIQIAGTYVATNQWSNTVTSGTTQSANFTIYPPLSTDNYTGPTAIQVWKDNIFGTFMFYPEN